MEVTLEQELAWVKVDLKKAEEKLQGYYEQIDNYKYFISTTADDIEDYKYQITELERQIKTQKEVEEEQ